MPLASLRRAGTNTIMVPARVTPEQVVLSVEHASARVPAALGHLGIPPARFNSHHGWDPGAAGVARRLAAGLGGSLHLGRWSRLVADLNRSSSHPRVIPRTSGGQRVPGNADLSRVERQDRLERFWHPYRDAVEADLDRAIAQFGAVLHISVHSFTPRLAGDTRRNHFGLLYKPSHRTERAMADRWHHGLAALGYRVRRNYPYSGLDDGFCMRMRAERSVRTYVGMEIEMNQRWVRTDAGVRRFAGALLDVIERELDG